MNKTQSPQKTKKNFDSEVIVAIFLLVLSVFLIFTVSVFVFRACSNAQIQHPNQHGITTPPTQNITPPINQSNAIFSGGVALPYAIQDENTKTVSSEIDAFYAILIDTQTGKIIAQKNADVIFSPASMTKVMTLIVACENLTEEDLERQLPFSHEVFEYVRSGNYMGMETVLPEKDPTTGVSCIGDTYTIRDLLYGIGVKSAADCTYMIAKEIAGTEENFVNMMNAKALELGLVDTHFDNVIGYDSATNITTAKDMAQIMAYAMQSEMIADILKPRTNRYTIYAHWDNSGVDTTYGVHFNPSYQRRLQRYPSFSPTGVDLEACKTGYTGESFIVTSAISKTTGARYVLVLGDKNSGTEDYDINFKNTMVDMETMFNTFVP